MIRVRLPTHLKVLAHIDGEVRLDVADPVTQQSVLDALEAQFPVLRGTIRDYGTHKRRAFIRYFACELDLSHEKEDAPLPDAVVAGSEPYMIVASMAGG
jgi:sulfur-carrier protein